MPRIAFLALRLFVAIAALAGTAAALFVILLTGSINLLKGGAHALAALIVLLTSGFQKSLSTPTPSEDLVPKPLVGLAVAFLAMFASVFTPGQKIYLHIVAAAAVIFGSWRLWSMAANPESPLMYMPVIALWFLYYAVCLRRG